MGKASKPRRVADNEAIAQGCMIRTSPRKLGLVANLISGMKADDALVQLAYSHRRIAKEVRSVLQAAIANAENNHGLDIDRLTIREASVGKSLTVKRFRPRARGRAGRIKKSFSRLRLVLHETSHHA